MKHSHFFPVVLILLVLTITSSGFGQRVLIGPRVTGNFNIYNQKGLTENYNGIGIGVGGTVDALFTENIGMMVNLTVFDMKNVSNSQIANNVTTETSASLSYLSLTPMFQAVFSGFYMMGGAAIGIKLNSSLEITQAAVNQSPIIQSRNLDTKSIKFDLAVGSGYSFKLSESMQLGTDIMAYIPITDTFNFPGRSNGTFTIQLGASLKFQI
jgi:hypothetical protein